MPTLTGLALARHGLDRRAETRGEEYDAFVEDPRARVLVLDDGRAPVVDGELVYVPPSTLTEPPPYLLGVDPSGVPYFAASRPPSSGTPSSGELLSLREAGDRLGPLDAGAFVHAQALINWHATHGFCARCGRPTEVRDAGHVRRCPDCCAEHFPRTDPAIIVLVTDDDGHALLGRGASWPEGRFSTIAGFVEPGEPLEAAVVREVHEETGVVATDPEYAGSQPWPFPSSLMLGFFARAVATDITIDENEIAEAAWFSRTELVEAYETGRLIRPTGISIARRLIETWLNGA